jgi:Cof subfamily protein (haloacid dehalogenase superfamily)
VIQLIGIDVDGTLVGSSGVVHPTVWVAAERATAAGIHLALCSGRPAFGVALEYAQRLDPGGWHVFQNGASVVHLATGSSRSAALPPGVAESLISQTRSSGDLLELYNDREIACESTHAWAREHADLLGIPFQPRPLESLAPPVVRAQWLVPVDKVAVVTKAAPQGVEVAVSTSPLMPETRFVGLTREGVSKGSAIRSLAEEYGIALADVMYIGDAGNDLSALKIVGYPVAMANASPDVLAAARRIVAHVDQGGVAEALEVALDSRGNR